MLSICGIIANAQLDKNPESFMAGLNGRPLVIGHRGGFDASLPENSISIFDFTYTNACSKPIGIEFDIRKSASGRLYIMHDSAVDRTTNGNGKITNLPDEYIRTLFLRDRTGKLTGEKIPLFTDILSFAQYKNIVLMLDVKGNIIPEVIALVNKFNLQSRCILLTFTKDRSKLAMQLAGKMMISAWIETPEQWQFIQELQIPAKQLITYISEKTPTDLANEIHDRNVLVMTDMSEGIRNKANRYDPGYYKAFVLKMNLGIIITDYPLFANKIYCNE